MGTGLIPRETPALGSPGPQQPPLQSGLGFAEFTLLLHKDRRSSGAHLPGYHVLWTHI